MNYRSQLAKISSAILNFDQENHGLHEILEQESIERFKVYRKNYFYHACEILSGDFIGVKKYLGESNFYYFVQKLLKEKGVTSPCIFDLSLEFQRYFEENYDLHQDALLDELAAIDLMWSHGFTDELEVSSGMLEFCQELVTGKESTKVVNLENPVKLKLIDHQGEQTIKLEL